MTGLLGTSEFEKLILNRGIMIDVRSPGEHRAGSAPGSICLPILDDNQRAEVGLCYKVKGRGSAIQFGHQLVSGEDKSRKIKAWLDAVKNSNPAAVYCARGGLRSKISQQWMAENGLELPRVSGGYKAFRRYLLAELTERTNTLNFVAIAGRTGVGKSEFIRKLSWLNVLDLELLANHRGSAFGGEITPQPRQVNFENELASHLIRSDRHQIVLVEDESALIGTCVVPPILFEKIKDSPVVILEASVEERVARTIKDYIVARLEQYRALADPTTAFLNLKEYLVESLKKIQRRLGATRTAEVSNEIEQALAHQEKTGSPDQHQGWVKRLLVEYYDPQYEYGRSKRRGQVVASGDMKFLEDFLRQYRPTKPN